MDYQTGNSQGYLYYMPLNVSDWYLVTIIPDTVTLSRFRYIFNGSGFLAAGTVSAFALLGVYAILLLRRKNNDIKKSSQELKTLTANIPGCVKRCKYDSNFTMIYCSDGFLQLTGYTRDEVNEFFEDKYINMSSIHLLPSTHPNVSAAVNASMFAQGTASQCLTRRYNAI